MQTNMAITDMAQVVQVILDRSQEKQAAACGFARSTGEFITTPDRRYNRQININYHDCTQEYSLNALTHEYQDFILNNLPTDHWVYNRILNAPVDNKMAINQLLHHLNTHDVIRKQNWQTVYPEFLNWYKRYI
jgi:hypothetical protein